jgi:hypothetical protein
LLLFAQSVVADASTFVGQVQANFRVTEVIDGTTTFENEPGTLNMTVTTDYTNMRWSLDFDVDLLISGSPGQPFETRLAASGNLLSRRCVSACSLDGPGSPSPLSFPNANGQSGAGSYVLLGSSEWTLTDRIVTTVRERHSPEKTVLGSGSISNNLAFNPGNHFLAVSNYPFNIQLTPGVSTRSAWQNENGQWMNGPVGGPIFHLGRITDGSDYLEVTITSFPSIVTLYEQLPGDFNDNTVVDAADYVVWRKAPGPLSPFITDIDVWRGNFGAALGARSVAGSAANVPEPSPLVMLLAAAAAMAWRR